MLLAGAPIPLLGYFHRIGKFFRGLPSGGPVIFPNNQGGGWLEGGEDRSPLGEAKTTLPKKQTMMFQESTTFRT